MHLQQVGYVFLAGCHSSPVIMISFWVSPIFQLKWGGVDEEEIRNFCEDRVKVSIALFLSLHKPSKSVRFGQNTKFYLRSR